MDFQIIDDFLLKDIIYKNSLKNSNNKLSLIDSIDMAICYIELYTENNWDNLMELSYCLLTYKYSESIYKLILVDIYKNPNKYLCDGDNIIEKIINNILNNNIIQLIYNINYLSEYWINIYNCKSRQYIMTKYNMIDDIINRMINRVDYNYYIINKYNIINWKDVNINDIDSLYNILYNCCENDLLKYVNDIFNTNNYDQLLLKFNEWKWEYERCNIINYINDKIIIIEQKKKIDNIKKLINDITDSKIQLLLLDILRDKFNL